MALYHCCSWLFLLGLAPFAFCFACLLDGETQIWLGDLGVAFWLVVFVSCSGFYDLPRYMTTCVHVEFISKCFFTCKDRALERDRPYRRKKKIRGTRSTWSTLWSNFVASAALGARYVCSYVASAAFSAAKEHFAWQAQHIEHVMIFLCGQRSIFSS